MPPPDAIPAGPPVQVFDWPATERLAEGLASRLRRELGPELSTFSFLAIPRGGVLVLGMLAYLLELEKDRIAAPGDPPPERVVLVDDCALSGARLARALERITAPRVVVAHLLSHPELRRSVTAAEPRVERCVAAGDLAARRDLPEAALAGFAERWRERLPGRRYWLGALEPVAFPWSEPEAVVWNARAGRLEDGWRRVPPRACLRFRAELRLPEAGGPAGPLALAPGVLWKLDGERLLLRTPGDDGRLFGFRDVALDIWRALLATGDLERSLRHLASRYEADETELDRDLRGFVAELLDRGLLVDAPGPPRS